MGNQLSIFQTTKLSRLLSLMDENPEVFEYTVRKGWFRDWLKDNMHLYNEFETNAFYLRREGKRTRYSARAIIHKMRWDTLFKEKEPTEFKINDHSTPYLARLVMLSNRELDGMFQLRTIGGPEDDTL